jgi:phosphoglycerate dehydrogenase-like enzyme
VTESGDVVPPTQVCLPDERARELVGEVSGVRVVVWDGSLPVSPEVAATEFLVGRYPGGPLSAEQLSHLPHLRVIQLMSAGADSWLPVVPPGVVLCSGRGVHGLSTAELAVGLVLSIVRELPRYLLQQAEELWQPGPRESLSDKRVLVVGAGDIGGHVGEVFTALGAFVTLMGRSARAGVIGLDQLGDVLPDQDVVVLAVPLTAQTTGLVDQEFLALLKDGAILVNVGRGATVVTAALVAELATGRLRAGLDVTDPEPLPPGHPLWHSPGLVLTPHMGGGTRGWDVRGYRLVRTQLERLTSGQPLLNVVSA